MGFFSLGRPFFFFLVYSDMARGSCFLHRIRLFQGPRGLPVFLSPFTLFPRCFVSRGPRVWAEFSPPPSAKDRFLEYPRFFSQQHDNRFLPAVLLAYPRCSVSMGSHTE